MNWKRIPDTKKYVVTDKGEVINMFGGGKHLKQHKNPNGYFYVRLSVNGKMINRSVHSLVALGFLGERPTGFICDHIDENKENNTLENLQYISQQDNLIKHHKLKMKEQITCKHVRKEGESCRLNNKCTYPNCPEPTGAFYVPVNRGNHYDGKFYPIDWSLLDDPNLLKKDKDASNRK